jgi:hypothetical protein
MTTVIRTVGFLVIAVLAATAFIVLEPKPATLSDNYVAAISQALSDGIANNATAQGAPQQSVVNGWTARDLLAILAKEQADGLKGGAQDLRVPALLLLGVLALCWDGLSRRNSLPHRPVEPQVVIPAPGS